MTPYSAAQVHSRKKSSLHRELWAVHQRRLFGWIAEPVLSDVFPALVFNDAVNPAGVLQQPVANYKIPRAYQFNAVLEKQLAGFVISAGYVAIGQSACL